MSSYKLYLGTFMAYFVLRKQINCAFITLRFISLFSLLLFLIFMLLPSPLVYEQPCVHFKNTISDSKIGADMLQRITKECRNPIDLEKEITTLISKTSGAILLLNPKKVIDAIWFLQFHRPLLVIQNDPKMTDTFSTLSRYYQWSIAPYNTFVKTENYRTIVIDTDLQHYNEDIAFAKRMGQSALILMRFPQAVHGSEIPFDGYPLNSDWKTLFVL